jgi:hypothetical protein
MLSSFSLPFSLTKRRLTSPISPPFDISSNTRSVISKPTGGLREGKFRVKVVPRKWEVLGSTNFGSPIAVIKTQCVWFFLRLVAGLLVYCSLLCLFTVLIWRGIWAFLLELFVGFR